MTVKLIASNPDLPGVFCLISEEVTGLGFQCTRTTGHPGSHMASGHSEPCVSWDEQLAWTADRWYINTENGWIAA